MFSKRKKNNNVWLWSNLEVRKNIIFRRFLLPWQWERAPVWFCLASLYHQQARHLSMWIHTKMRTVLQETYGTTQNNLLEKKVSLRRCYEETTHNCPAATRLCGLEWVLSLHCGNCFIITVDLFYYSFSSVFVLVFWYKYGHTHWPILYAYIRIHKLCQKSHTQYYLFEFLIYLLGHD